METVKRSLHGFRTAATKIIESCFYLILLLVHDSFRDLCTLNNEMFALLIDNSLTLVGGCPNSVSSKRFGLTRSPACAVRLPLLVDFLRINCLKSHRATHGSA